MPKDKKKKITFPSIQFIYPDNKCKSYVIDTLVFDEEQVIAGSIMFFCDPEPCMIHRGAVISRYIDEIFQWLQTVDCAKKHDISAFPEELLKNIDTAVTKDAQGFKVFIEGEG